MGDIKRIVPKSSVSFKMYHNEKSEEELSPKLRKTMESTTNQYENKYNFKNYLGSQNSENQKSNRVDYSLLAKNLENAEAHKKVQEGSAHLPENHKRHSSTKEKMTTLISTKGFSDVRPASGNQLSSVSKYKDNQEFISSQDLVSFKSKLPQQRSQFDSPAPTTGSTPIFNSFQSSGKVHRNNFSQSDRQHSEYVGVPKSFEEKTHESTTFRSNVKPRVLKYGGNKIAKKKNPNNAKTKIIQSFPKVNEHQDMYGRDKLEVMHNYKLGSALADHQYPNELEANVDQTLALPHSGLNEYYLKYQNDLNLIQNSWKTFNHDGQRQENHLIKNSFVDGTPSASPQGLTFYSEPEEHRNGNFDHQKALEGSTSFEIDHAIGGKPETVENLSEGFQLQPNPLGHQSILYSLPMITGVPESHLGLSPNFQREPSLGFPSVNMDFSKNFYKENQRVIKSGNDINDQVQFFGFPMLPNNNIFFHSKFEGAAGTLSPLIYPYNSMFSKPETTPQNNIIIQPQIKNELKNRPKPNFMSDFGKKKKIQKKEISHSTLSKEKNFYSNFINHDSNVWSRYEPNQEFAVSASYKIEKPRFSA